MATTGPTTGPTTVPATGPLRKPPVRQAVLVRSDVRHTFDTFVATISAWWPVQPFSCGQDRVRQVTIEPRLGGRVYETWDDGTEIEWGELLDWQPPTLFLMTWFVGSGVTQVELRFKALGPALTRVAVEHRGWEALTDEQLDADCALPGGYRAGAFDEGWRRILGQFAAAIGAADGEPDGPEGASA